MSLTYGFAESRDFDRVSELFSEMLRSIYVDKVWSYAPGELDHFFDGGEDVIFVARDDDTIVAYLAVDVHREDTGFLYLEDFSVTEAYRGRGIGTALEARAAEYAHSLGLAEVRLHVESTNTRAESLYTRLGYSFRELQGTRRLMVKEL